MLKHQRLRGWLGLLVFPIWWTLGVARHASLQPTWPRKIGLFASFVPVLLFHSLLWLGALALAWGILVDVLHRGLGTP